MWMAERGGLMWVDILRGELLFSREGSEVVQVLEAGPPIGGFTRQADDSLLLFRAGGVVQRFTCGLETICEGLPGEENSRFNDLAATPEGEVLCGTMPTPERQGRLYRMKLDGRFDVLLEGVGCSNGIGFSPDRSLVYFTDSAVGIDVFDYRQGSLLERRPFFRTQNGVCDGLTVDVEGCVWSAIWGEGCVLRIAPNGEVVDRIELAAKHTTCPTFGGTDYEMLFVTSAGGDERPETGEFAGAVFAIDAGVGGTSEYRSRIQVP